MQQEMVYSKLDRCVPGHWQRQASLVQGEKVEKLVSSPLYPCLGTGHLKSLGGVWYIFHQTILNLWPPQWSTICIHDPPYDKLPRVMTPPVPGYLWNQIKYLRNKTEIWIVQNRGLFFNYHHWSHDFSLNTKPGLHELMLI